MKVLIIGGNRYFGRRLVSRLVERGDHVTVLNRGNLDDGMGDRVQRIRADRKTLTPDDPSIRDQSFDAVVDQACFSGEDAKRACALFQGKTSRLVFTSSQSVYGEGAGILESTFDPKTYAFESTPHSPADYAEAKRQAEAEYFRAADFSVAAVRFPIVLGEDDYTRRLHFHVERIRDAKPIYFPNRDARISFIRSVDAAAGLEFLLDSKFTGSVNCAAPEPIVLRDLVALIEQTVGKKILWAEKPDSENQSPFGAESDWWMNTDLIRSLGFAPMPIDRWLPELVAKLAKTG